MVTSLYDCDLAILMAAMLSMAVEDPPAGGRGRPTRWDEMGCYEMK